MSSTGPISRAGIESAWQVPLRLSRTLDSTSPPMDPLSLAPTERMRRVLRTKNGASREIDIQAPRLSQRARCAAARP